MDSTGGAATGGSFPSKLELECELELELESSKVVSLSIGDPVGTRYGIRKIGSIRMTLLMPTQYAKFE